MVDEVPENIAKLLRDYKTGGKKALSSQQFEELAGYLINVEVQPLVMGDPFKFTKAGYDALMKAIGRTGASKKPKEIKPEQELARHEREAEAKFWKGIWERSHAVAMRQIRRWEPRIIEMGYTMEVEGNVFADSEKFIGDAIDFFVTQGRRVKEIEQENVALVASIELLAAMYDGVILKFNEVRMAVLMTEAVNQNFEQLPLILSPIKSRL